MPQTIRFHLDEHVDPAIAVGLRRRGIPVTTSAEVGLLSAPDEEQLEHCLVETRVLVTFDQDFLAHAGRGTPHAGIAYRFQGNRDIGRIIRRLEQIWNLLETDEMFGHVEYL